jgi:hypothetical protein
MKKMITAFSLFAATLLASAANAATTCTLNNDSGSLLNAPITFDLEKSPYYYAFILTKSGKLIENVNYETAIDPKKRTAYADSEDALLVNFSHFSFPEKPLGVRIVSLPKGQFQKGELMIVSQTDDLFVNYLTRGLAISCKPSN